MLKFSVTFMSIRFMLKFLVVVCGGYLKLKWLFNWILNSLNTELLSLQLDHRSVFEIRSLRHANWSGLHLELVLQMLNHHIAATSNYSALTVIFNTTAFRELPLLLPAGWSPVYWHVSLQQNKKLEDSSLVRKFEYNSLSQIY